jgi:TetR/AcrR family transcriptional regulator, cholesterol catabolism regulator
MEIRNLIIEAASELFRDYGIKSVTMDSIAAHLGISKRTIYEKFSDKDDLLVGVLNWMGEKQKELVTRVLNESGNAIVAIFKLMEINLNHFQEMSPAFHADMKKFHQQILMKKSFKCEIPDYRYNIQLIEKGIRDELFRREINPDLVNRCLNSIIRSIMDQELFPFGQFQRREVLKNTVVSYLRGISSMKGIELINQLETEF